MEKMRKAYKKADIVSTLLIISVVISVVLAAVVGIMGKWILLAACAVLAITLATICNEVCYIENVPFKKGG